MPNNNISGDSFLVSSYLRDRDDNYKMQSEAYSQAAIDEAIRWAEEAIRVIITPTKDLQDLEAQWLRFNEMPLKHRRESDWKCLELFGMTNQDLYERLAHDLSDKFIDRDIAEKLSPPVQDVDAPIAESYIDTLDTHTRPAHVSYTSTDVDNAILWAHESNRVIIVPTNTLEALEELWDDFNRMIMKHRRESDWMSLETFGITNQQHYEYLKAQFISADSADEYDFIHGALIESSSISRSKKYVRSICKEESIFEATKMMLEMVRPSHMRYEEALIKNIIDDALNNYEGITSYSTIDPNSFGDLPCFTTDDMVDMGVFGQSPADNYYGVVADNDMISNTITVQEWFENYKCTCEGFYTEFNSMNSAWVNKVRELTYGLAKLKESGDEDAYKARCQSILELGWNPDLEFNDRNRILAKQITETKIMKNNSVSRVIDLREFNTSNYSNKDLDNDSNTSDEEELQPVYIVLTQGGKNPLAGTIRVMFKEEFAHASLSLDHTMENMYSYAVENPTKSLLKGGFVIEDIKKLPKNYRIRVSAIFLPKRLYAKIVNMVDTFKENKKNTRYSYRNLFTYLFNVPYNQDWNLICSQFVDRCLKVAGVDINHKDSSLVSPSDFLKNTQHNNRIYTIFDGITDNYNASKIGAFINKLRKKAKPIKESQLAMLLNEMAYVNSMIYNINDIDHIRENSSMLDTMDSTTLSRMIMENLIDGITIRPYIPTQPNSKPTVEEVNMMANRFITPF